MMEMFSVVTVKLTLAPAYFMVGSSPNNLLTLLRFGFFDGGLNPADSHTLEIDSLKRNKTRLIF